jgi:hypothetical protein
VSFAVICNRTAQLLFSGLTPADREHLSNKGYVVSEGRLPKVTCAATVQSKTVRDFPCRTHPVFNDTGPEGVPVIGENSKRRQVELAQHWSVSKKAFAVAKTDHPLNTPEEGRLMMSLEGCEQQPWHTDFPPGELVNGAFTPGELVNGAQASYVMMVALQANTCICLYEGSHLIYDDPAKRASARIVTLQQGDVLYMHSLLMHAGAAYNKRNVRLHLYLAAPGADRETNTVFPLSSLPSGQKLQFLG